MIMHDGVIKWHVRFSADKCTWDPILIFCIKTSGTELNFAQELKILTLCSKEMLAQSTVAV